jgi:hypothetical protein
MAFMLNSVDAMIKETPTYLTAGSTYLTAILAHLTVEPSLTNDYHSFFYICS